MTDPDTLSRDIHALKELQRVAWSQLADPSLTVFDRREIRNRIRQSEAELRIFLDRMSEHVNAPRQPAPDRRIRKPNLRLVAID